MTLRQTSRDFWKFSQNGDLRWADTGLLKICLGGQSKHPSAVKGQSKCGLFGQRGMIWCQKAMKCWHAISYQWGDGLRERRQAQRMHTTATPGQAHLDTLGLVGTGGWRTGGKGELVLLGAVSLSSEEKVRNYIVMMATQRWTCLMPPAVALGGKESSLETF